MATNTNKSILKPGKQEISDMENKAMNLKAKTPQSKSKPVISQHGTKINNMPVFERELIHKRVSFPSYRGALKWMKDNKETIETFIDLLNIHPELIRHKMLDKFLSYLNSYRFQTNQIVNRLSEKSPKLTEGTIIPSITITPDAYTRNVDNEDYRLLIIGYTMFKEDERSCGEFISALSQYFVIKCHDFDVSNGYVEMSQCDVCIFLLSSSSADNTEYISLFQHAKMLKTPVLVVRSTKTCISEQIKEGRSLSMCSVYSNDALNPISLPLPPISRTPNILTTESLPPVSSNFSILEMKRLSIEYDSSDIWMCVLQVCRHFRVTDKELAPEQKVTDKNDKIKNLSQQETTSNNNYLRISPIHSPSHDFLRVTDRHLLTLSRQKTHGTVESLTNKDGRPSKGRERRGNSEKITTSPHSNNCKHTMQGYNVDSHERIITLPESPIDETIFLLFSTKKDDISTKVVSWPKDIIINDNDDCVSEDSSSIGFQDVDFASSLWSYNSEED